MLENNFDDIVASQNEQINKLNDIVQKSIEEENLLSEKLLEFEDRNPSFKSRLADYVANFGGSWMFIISFTFIMFVWISSNLYFINKPFDPYPFILLNLVLSTIAALQAPIIMMSQNRKEEKDRQRAINDYLINLKAEIEVKNVHKKLDLLMTEQMKTLFDIQKTQIDLMNEIRAFVKTKSNK